LEAIWAKILAARSGRPTILRALDDANPFVSRWNRDQIFSTCTTYWEAVSEAARAAAEHYSIPFLSRYDAYNGKDHTIDPGLGGYIGGDGIHPSKLAQQHTADLLAQMGYEAVMPP
jgi:lysophospholipase L1-like esterase